jgi:hypothetical protein
MSVLELRQMIEAAVPAWVLVVVAGAGLVVLFVRAMR